MLNRAKIAYKAAGAGVPEAGDRRTTRRFATASIKLLVEQAELDQKAASMGITVTNADITTRLEFREEAVLRQQREEVLAAAKKQGYTGCGGSERRDPAATHVRASAEAGHEGREGHELRSRRRTTRATRRTTRNPSHATFATSSSARARRPRSRSTASSQAAPTRRGARSRRATQRIRAARTAARRRSRRDRRSRSSTRPRSRRPPTRW